jgi:uncharacterized membrane protein YgdD (TMEM256/DUF423 family)
MQGKLFLIIGGYLAAAAVGLGAMGAHLVRDKLTVEQLAIFEMAARYQMYHSVGLILAGLATRSGNHALLLAAGWLFLTGILLFSGGIYGWLYTGFKPLAHIVPIGGSLWLVAWVCFANGCWSSDQ